MSVQSMYAVSHNASKNQGVVQSAHPHERTAPESVKRLVLTAGWALNDYAFAAFVLPRALRLVDRARRAVDKVESSATPTRSNTRGEPFPRSNRSSDGEPDE